MKFLVSLLVSLGSLSVWADCKAGKDETAYKVKGMHCAACVSSVQGYFSKVTTVAKADVSLPNQCLKLSLKPGAKLSKAEVAEGLKGLGYELDESPAKAN